jgi:DNA-binding CsgD family transcriptional regulator
MPERVAQSCRSAVDALDLRLCVTQELRAAIGFDAFAFVLTDPHTCVGSAPYADVPWLDELPTLIRLRYQTPVNRWTTLHSPPVGLLLEATRGEPGRSVLWRELLSQHGVTDAASVAFRDRFGVWAFLELWRCAPAAGFSEDDADLLAAIVGPVTTAIRRTTADTFTAGEREDRARLGPLVLLLSPDLAVVGQTADTDAVLRGLLAPPPARSPVPAAAYNVAAQLLANESGVDDHPPRARVHLRHGTWLTLGAGRIGSGPTGRRDIAVTIEATSAADRFDLFARATGLSAREQQVIRLIVAGMDTAGIATDLHISTHTVLDQREGDCREDRARRPAAAGRARSRRINRNRVRAVSACGGASGCGWPGRRGGRRCAATARRAPGSAGPR